MEPLNIVWNSVSPWIPSGYGQQTAQACRRLRDAGHNVAISAFVGMEGTVSEWEGITVFPTDHTRFNKYALKKYVQRHSPTESFDDVLVITLQDVWTWLDATYQTGGMQADYQGLNIASWVPIHHDPMPLNTAQALQAFNARPIAMSKFGEDRMRARGFDPLYVPHAVDTSVLCPRPDAAAQVREALNVTDDAFLIGMVSHNQGIAPSRKSFPEVFHAFSMFVRDHPDAILYLHTDVLGINQGLNLTRMWPEYGIPEDNIRIVNQDKYGTFCELETLHMSYMYSALDVLACPSYAEGFGIPIIEAQACFPAGTPVEVIDPLATLTKSYTGRMVTLTTGRGSFEATEDHPVWTDNGWQLAGSVRPGDRLLYCVDAAQGMEQVHTGAIDEVVNALQNNAIEGSGERSGDVVQRCVLSTSKSWSSQEAVLVDRRISSRHADQSAVALLGGAGGWGRNGDDQEVASWCESESSMEALRDRVEHGQAADGLAHDSNTDFVGVRGLAKDAQSFDVVSVLGDRAWLPASVRGATASVGAQGRPDGTGDRVDARAVVTIADGPLDPEAARDRVSDPRSEFDTVTAVSERHVRNLPVFNVTTASSTYRVGAGYLVHNCGTPVIATDWTSMPELIGPGWLCDGEPYRDAGSASMWMKPAVSEILRCLEAAYAARGDQGISSACRENALQYDADKVFEEHWVPTLETLSRPREVPPLPTLNREQRRSRVKAQSQVAA